VAERGGPRVAVALQLSQHRLVGRHCA
jgi:hypothetical protein